jgi:transglutaminase-like putative cysteine protease
VRTRATRAACAATLGLLWVTLGVAGPAASSPYIDVSQVETLAVTHRTVVDLDGPAQALRVFHARPVEPAWIGEATAWVIEPAFDPAGAEWQPAPEGGSYWRWERFDLAPGKHEFESRFDLVTARRELRTDRLHVRWEEIAQVADEIPPSQRGERLDVPATLREVARKVRDDYASPLDAIVALTRWIDDNIEYDAGVRYDTSDLAAIVDGRKGHCGHRFNVFKGLCQELGIPVGRAVGFNLRNKSGLWNGREDWNRHTWAEVRLPHVGWVEVEPAESRTPFAIPRTYVKNPPELQSSSVWIQRDGQWSRYRSSLDTIRVEPAARRPATAAQEMR